jgi:hypothetical protein
MLSTFRLTAARALSAAIIGIAATLGLSVAPAAAHGQAFKCGNKMGTGVISFRACSERIDGGPGPLFKDTIKFSIRMYNNSTSTRTVTYAPWIKNNLSRYEPQPLRSVKVGPHQTIVQEYYSDTALPPSYRATAVRAIYAGASLSGWAMVDVETGTN